MCQYLENCRRYVHGYYLWLIGSCICAFDCHKDRWPWMTLNSIFLGISQISDGTTAKRMKIDQYCQRQRCKHVELEQFWHAFASRGFVSDSWTFLYFRHLAHIHVMHTSKRKRNTWTIHHISTISKYYQKVARKVSPLERLSTNP